MSAAAAIDFAEEARLSAGGSPVRLLLVSHWERDHSDLRSILDTDYELRGAAGVAEAAKSIRRRPPRVVICERSLPDGGWRELFAALQESHDPAVLIVASLHADDRLWVEVLNLGGYDVLLKPFVHSEVVRVLERAAVHGAERRR